MAANKNAKIQKAERDALAAKHEVEIQKLAQKHRDQNAKPRSTNG